MVGAISIGVGEELRGAFFGALAFDAASALALGMEPVGALDSAVTPAFPALSTWSWVSFGCSLLRTLVV